MSDTAQPTDGDDDGIPEMAGARLFVTVVFTVIGVSFIAATALVIWEFGPLDWASIVLLHSHFFLFFPTLGLLALVAFHLPATVFTHMYWTYIPHGRLRYCIGALAAVALALGASVVLDTRANPEIWQIAPHVLAGDRGEPAGCDASRQSCRRLTVLEGVSGLREAAKARFGVSKFARPCHFDPLMEVPDDFGKVRYCFASGSMLDGAQCCAAQDRFKGHLRTMATDPADRSLSAAFNVIAQPLKAFFVTVVVVIGVLLVIWRRLLEEKYAAIAPAIERALFIGAAAMLPWPFMDYAYQQGMETLTGRATAAPELRLSLVIAPWALLLLVFFLARMGRKIERLGQLAGACASLVALLRYNELNDVAVGFVGVGAPIWMIAVLVGLTVLGLMSLRWPRHLQRAINGAIGRHPDVGAAPPRRTGAQAGPVDGNEARNGAASLTGNSRVPSSGL